MMIKVITCGKVVASYEDSVFGQAGAIHQAKMLSTANREVPVYIQDGRHRAIYRNGVLLFM